MSEGAPLARPSVVNAVPREGRPFQGLRAGVVTRVVANTIDFLLILVALLACYLGYAAVLLMWHTTTFTMPVPSLALALLVGAWLTFVYLAACWATTGRTYGDHLLGLRVVSFRGRRMRLAGAIARSAFCVVFPIGVFWCAVSRENRSVQDIALRTSVVYDWQVRT